MSLISIVLESTDAEEMIQEIERRGMHSNSPGYRVINEIRSSLIDIDPTVLKRRPRILIETDHHDTNGCTNSISRAHEVSGLLLEVALDNRDLLTDIRDRLLAPKKEA